MATRVIRHRIVKSVFLKELREVLRDRRSLAVMFGVSLVLYPEAAHLSANARELVADE